MKKKIIFSMSCIALLSILLSMVLSGVVFNRQKPERGKHYDFNTDL